MMLPAVPRLRVDDTRLADTARALGGQSHPGQGHAGHRHLGRALNPLCDVGAPTRWTWCTRGAQGLAKRITTLPPELRRSITWDQGKEMAEHLRFTFDTDVQVYFCDSKSPGNAGQTKTRTASCASTFPGTPNSRASRASPRLNSTSSPGNSTSDLDEPLVVCHHLRCSPRLLHRLFETAPNMRHLERPSPLIPTPIKIEASFCQEGHLGALERRPPAGQGR
jgi:hypothetical protein